MLSVNGVVQTLDIKAPRPSAASAELDGLTFAVKDMFDLAGETAGFGCPDWKASHKPANSNAPAVQTLLESGAHLTANTVCDELAFSLDGINEHYGTPINPLAPGCIPGGSSSGPASVVAQGLCDFALGTDTAGSTRVPASYCGLWGLRPSHGSISLDGVLPLGPTFDTVGILARDRHTLSKVWQALTSGQNIGPDTYESRPTTLIAVSECFELLDPALLPPVMAMVDKLATLFEQMVKRSVVEDGLETLVANFAAIRGLEAWQCHSHWYETTKPSLSAAVSKRFLACAQATAEQAQKARQYRQGAQAAMAGLLEQNILCLPTTGQMPPKINATDQELEHNRSLNLRLNSIASFLGLPQLTIPISDNRLGPLPSGLSLIGKKGSEQTLLALARQLTK